jgi:hypothetical protein
MRPIRFLFASRPVITGQVLGIVNRVIAMHLVKKAWHGCRVWYCVVIVGGV